MYSHRANHLLPEGIGSNCATVIVANHRYIDEQNMGGGDVSICYSKSTKPYHASMYLPGVCGWGNGDMREEQTLQESGKLAHSEERAPCVRKVKKFIICEAIILSVSPVLVVVLSYSRVF